MTENTKPFSFESQFWLKVMGDHMRFINHALPPREEERAQQSEHFITLFDTLHAQSSEYLPDIAADRFFKTAFDSVQQARAYALSLLRAQISGGCRINISPAYMNQMVSEAEEYLRILSLHEAGGKNNMHPIHHHLLWLMGFSLQADIINANLDATERELVRQCHRFMHKFDSLYLKSIQFMGFLRAGLIEFPALSRMNTEVKEQLRLFADFLMDLERSLENREVLGPLGRLQVNHMYREICYYATQISETAAAKPESGAAFNQKK